MVSASLAWVRVSSSTPLSFRWFGGGDLAGKAGGELGRQFGGAFGWPFGRELGRQFGGWWTSWLTSVSPLYGCRGGNNWFDGGSDWRFDGRCGGRWFDRSGSWLDWSKSW